MNHIDVRRVVNHLPSNTARLTGGKHTHRQKSKARQHSSRSIHRHQHHINEQVKNAIIHSNIAALKTLIADGVHIESSCAALKASPLQIAASKDDAAMVEFLMSIGATEKCVSALQISVRKGSHETLRVLVRRGLLTRTDSHDVPALHEAARYKQEQAFIFLMLSGADEKCVFQKVTASHRAKSSFKMNIALKRGRRLRKLAAKGFNGTYQSCNNDSLLYCTARIGIGSIEVNARRRRKYGANSAQQSIVRIEFTHDIELRHVGRVVFVRSPLLPGVELVLEGGEETLYVLRHAASKHCDAFRVVERVKWLEMLVQKHSARHEYSNTTHDAKQDIINVREQCEKGRKFCAQTLIQLEVRAEEFLRMGAQSLTELKQIESVQEASRLRAQIEVCETQKKRVLYLLELIDNEEYWHTHSLSLTSIDVMNMAVNVPECPSDYCMEASAPSHYDTMHYYDEAKPDEQMDSMFSPSAPMQLIESIHQQSSSTIKTEKADKKQGGKSRKQSRRASRRRNKKDKNKILSVTHDDMVHTIGHDNAHIKAVVVEPLPLLLDEQHDSSSSSSCVVCLDEQSTIVSLPCRHMCLGSKCAKFGWTSCPVCCTPVEKLLEIFIS